LLRLLRDVAVNQFGFGFEVCQFAAAEVGEEVAVELDLTRKRSARYAGIIRAYRKEPYKRVLWYIVAEKTPRKAGEESSRVRDLRTIMVKNEAASLIEVREWIPTVGHDHDH